MILDPQRADTVYSITIVDTSKSLADGRSFLAYRYTGHWGALLGSALNLATNAPREFDGGVELVHGELVRQPPLPTGAAHFSLRSSKRQKVGGVFLPPKLHYKSLQGFAL